MVLVVMIRAMPLRWPGRARRVKPCSRSQTSPAALMARTTTT